MAKKLDNKDLEQVSGGIGSSLIGPGEKVVVPKGAGAGVGIKPSFQPAGVQPKNPINPVINPNPKQPSGIALEGKDVTDLNKVNDDDNIFNK